MTVAELTAIVEDQLKAANARRTMRRDALSAIRFVSDFATIVMGVRRCGKSTLAAQCRKSFDGAVLALNFDDLRMMNFAAEDFRALDKVIEARKARLLVFDEIHNVTGWELYVRQKLDQGYKVLVTGSNATMLSRELGTKLSGRHLDVELFPFSYSEYLRFVKRRPGVTSFKAYVRSGGFPGYLATNEKEVLRELVGDILYKDVAVRNGIRDVRPLQELCSFLLCNVGNRVSPSRLKDALHVKSSTTVMEYFNHLENAYFVQRLEAYSESVKARLLAPKKIYVADTALSVVMKTSQSEDDGHYLENIVYWHIRRSATEVYYFDEGHGECDFVFKDNDNRFHAVQVCWHLDDENRDREMKGLLAALRRFGLKSGTIVTLDQSDFAVEDGCDIHIVSAADYLTKEGLSS